MKFRLRLRWGGNPCTTGSGNAFPGMIQWFFDIPSKLIHWRLNLVRTLGAYVPWLRRDDGSMKVHAGTLVDLFATILSGRRHLSARDADAALDILRYTFPEVEHRWLSNRFERSMRASLTVADVLASAASGRDETERMAIALEVLSLLCKPNVDYYRTILEQFHLRPEECLMVGNDVEEDLAIRKLGVKTFLVTDTKENKKDLPIESDYQGSMEELFAFVESLENA